MTRGAVAGRGAAGAVAVAFLLSGIPLLGQAPAVEEPLPSFEVASVKKAGDSSNRLTISSGQGGRLTIGPLPLRSLIVLAWGIRADQLIGGPRWLGSDRFSINAKAETNVPREQLLLMLRSLLAERFQLKMRREPRETSMYVLTRPNPEQPLGARLRPSTCPDPSAAAGRASAPAPAGAPGSATSATPGSAPAGARGTALALARPTTMSSLPNVRCGSLSLGNGVLRGGGVPLSTLASLMGSSLGGQVLDRTGLTGRFDVELEFQLSGSLQAAAPGAVVPTGGDGPSVFSAVEDLGLKLERRRERLDSFVIERVEQPDED